MNYTNMPDADAPYTQKTANSKWEENNVCATCSHAL